MAYIQGAVASVPTGDRARYREVCGQLATVFKEHGALRVVDAWGVDVSDGKVTDFKRAVQATDDETVVFSWIVWPDRATCDAAGEKLRADPRMWPEGGMPFDTQRMIYGGFEPVFDSDEG